MEVGAVENDVFFGHESELFLASGGHRVLEYVRRERTVSDAALKAFVRNIRSRLQYAQTKDIGYLHLICPDKHSVLVDRLPISGPMKVAPLFLSAMEADADRVLYPVELLQQQTKSSYLKTDTHFSDVGAIAVGISVAERLTGLDLEFARAYFNTAPTMFRSHVGDLGCKLAPEKSHEECFTRTSWPHHYFNNHIDGGNNGAVDIIFSPNARLKKRLLWMGDSCGRHITKFLSYVFYEILFLRTPFFHPDILDQFRPDYLVTENVERYLPSTISDDERPCFHLFPQLNGKTSQLDKEFCRAFSAVLSFPRSPYRSFIESLTFGKSAAAMQVSNEASSNTSISASDMTIAIPGPCLTVAAELAVKPEIHPADFIFKFGARRWRNEPVASINHYYRQGKYSANLLGDFLKEVSRVKTFLGETWAPESILDFASGYGCCSRHFSNVLPGLRVATSDIHEEAVAFNKDVLGLESYLSKLVPEDVDLPQHDVVVAMSFFSHMPQSTYARWLRALFQAVRPRGVMIFTANGHVTERKATTKVIADESGFGFDTRSEQLDLAGENYGITISHPRWVLEQLHAIPGLRVARFQEGLWWAIQDTYVCIRD